MTLFFASIAVIAWLVPVDAEWFWAVRLGPIVIAAIAAWNWLMQESAQGDEAPDWLAEQFGSYFEQDGFCFCPRLHVEDGACWFQVYCQNRYLRECHATICLVPMEGLSKTGPHEVQPVYLELNCGGGEVAVATMPYPISQNWQGRIMVYDVTATTNYPDGQGDCLRTGRGAPVGEPTSELVENLKMAGMLVLGKIRITKGASMELQLPQGVRSFAMAEDDPIATRVIWEPSALSNRL